METEQKTEAQEVAQTNRAEEVKNTTILEVGKEEKVKPKKRLVSIDKRDYAYLRKSRYEEERKKWKTTFILQHKHNPEKIVELRASSPAHACNMIHWKPNQVRLLGTKTDATDDVVDNVSKAVTKLAEASISGATSIV